MAPDIGWFTGLPNWWFVLQRFAKGRGFTGEQEVKTKVLLSQTSFHYFLSKWNRKTENKNILIKALKDLNKLLMGSTRIYYNMEAINFQKINFLMCFYFAD